MSNNNKVVIVLEWDFSPSDFFEEPIHLDFKEYTINIENGKIDARIHENIFENEDKMWDIINENVLGLFLGAQLITHKKFVLSKDSMYRLYPDGHKEYKFSINVAIRPTANFELRITGKNGKIICDTRRERIEKRKYLAEYALKHINKDGLAKFILASYNSAVNDPMNELVHLYEIRDALTKNFGNEEDTYKTLGISKRSWKRLGRLANHEPLLQGRHRGKKLGELRKATNTELEEARGIAKDMIIAYLEYLESQNSV